MQRGEQDTDTTLHSSLSPEVLVEALPLVAYAADARGRVTRVNRHWQEYTGFEQLESLGYAGADAIHPDDVPRVLACWERAVQTLEPYECTYRLRRADGAYRLHLGRAGPVFGADGAVLGWVGTATDIHDLDLERETQAFTALVRSAPFGLHVVDSDLCFVEISQGARRALEAYTPQVGQPFEPIVRAVWPDALAEEVLRQYRHTLATGEPYGFANTTERRADHDREESYEWTLERVPLPGGGYGVACHFYDLTERRRSETHARFLLELDALLREIEDPDALETQATHLLGMYLGASRCLLGFIAGDRALVQRDWSPHLPSVKGVHDLSLLYSPEALGDLTTGEVRVVAAVHTDPRTRLGADHFARLQIGAFVDVPLFSDGAWVGMLAVHSAVPRAWRDDEVQLVRDAAARVWPELERARALIARAESEARYRTLFNSVDDGFCICEMIFDTDGRATDYRFLEVNPAFARQAGVLNAGGRTAHELVAGLEPEWADVFAQVVESGESVRFERSSEAMGRVFSVYACRIGGAGSARFSVLFRDITAERSAHQRLEEVNEAQRRFVNDAAHELRAPLTAIRGNLSLLRRFPDTPSEDRAEMLGDMEREATRLTRLIADLLAVARGEAQQVVEPEQVRLERIVDEAWRTARSLSERRRFDLGHIEALVVQGDPDALKQLLLILLENAVKYSPEDGVVRLELRRTDAQAELRVWNAGAGIAPEDLERVFERFYRTERARSREGGTSGTGLGLTIARQIAFAHGGQLWLESVIGQGTTAVLRLPLLGDHTASQATPDENQ
jgi:PAS domain S-box-containing protein